MITVFCRMITTKHSINDLPGGIKFIPCPSSLHQSWNSCSWQDVFYPLCGDPVDYCNGRIVRMSITMRHSCLEGMSSSEQGIGSECVRSQGRSGKLAWKCSTHAWSRSKIVSWSLFEYRFFSCSCGHELMKGSLSWGNWLSCSLSHCSLHNCNDLTLISTTRNNFIIIANLQLVLGFSTELDVPRCGRPGVSTTGLRSFSDLSSANSTLPE